QGVRLSMPTGRSWGSARSAAARIAPDIARTAQTFFTVEYVAFFMEVADNRPLAWGDGGPARRRCSECWADSRACKLGSPGQNFTECRGQLHALLGTRGRIV